MVRRDPVRSQEVMMRLVVLFSAFALALGCAAAPAGSGFTSTGNAGAGNTGTGAGGAGTGTDTGIGGSFNPGTGTTGGDPSCSAAAALVYVLSTNNELYSFDPGMKAFERIGTIDCNVPSGAKPNSMAVDRDANAWVNYIATNGLSLSGGWVYKVSTADASCAPSASVTLSNAQFYQLGMGFSTDAASGTTETLYVTGTGTPGFGNSPGLAKIDPGTLQLSPVGQFSGDSALTGQSAELTGTGDARLFGFFTTTPVRVAQIDKTSGAILSDMEVTGVAMPAAWAFSFWGGSFYLYTSNGLNNSTVTKVDPTTMTVDASYVLTAPIVIDGAGVSTCAPLTPPK
jgi:hypothetical protein